jgi:hypothetical protein
VADRTDTTATTIPSGCVRLTAKGAVLETPDERVHLAASGFSGNATLCGYLGDYYVAHPQPSSARVNCPGCLDVVLQVRKLRVKIRERGGP